MPKEEKIVPPLAVGSPWNLADMATALDILDSTYRESGAEKTINPNVAADYAALCTVIAQAEEAAKEGRSEDAEKISGMARKYASNCLHGTSIPGTVIEDPLGEGEDTPWPLERMHYFQNVFSYIVYSRILNPLGKWEDVNCNIVNGQYGSYMKSVSDPVRTEADRIASALAASWKYTVGEASEAGLAYINGDLRGDLYKVFMSADGRGDCTSEFLGGVISRIKASVPAAAATEMPLLKLPEGKILPKDLRTALGEYAEKALDYDKKVTDLEALAGPADPDFSFDYEKYEKDIDNCVNMVRFGSNEYFEHMYGHIETIKKLENYVKSNDYVLANYNSPKEAVGGAGSLDFDVEKQLVEQLCKYKVDPRGDLKNVKNLNERPDATRKYIVDALKFYADLPNRYIGEYAENIARNVMDTPYSGIKSSVGGYICFSEHKEPSEMTDDESDDFEREKALNWTPVDNKIVLDYVEEDKLTPEEKKALAKKRAKEKIKFEDEVNAPILKFCKEENLLTKTLEDGKTVNLEAALEKNLKILVRWLNTSRKELGIYQDMPFGGGRNYTYGKNLTSAQSVAALKEVNGALIFVREIAEKAGLGGSFKLKISNRPEIEKDLRSLADLLTAKHMSREMPKVAKELAEKNLADQKTAWKKLSADEIQKALDERNELIDKIGDDIEQMGELCGKGFCKNELGAISADCGASLKTMKITAESLAKKLAEKRVEEAERQRKEAEKEKKAAEKRAKEEKKRLEREKKEAEAREKAEREKAEKAENAAPENEASVENAAEDGSYLANAMANAAENGRANDNAEYDPDDIFAAADRMAAANNEFDPDSKKYDTSRLNPARNTTEEGITRDGIVAIARALVDEGHVEHDEFDRMKAALNAYAEAVKRYGFNGIHPKEVAKVYPPENSDALAEDQTVLDAANEAYAACLAYLETHLETSVTHGRVPLRDDTVQKKIGGQWSASGRLRKQAALAAMRMFTSLPESADVVRAYDSIVTYRTDREKIHSRDFDMLENSLKPMFGGGAYVELSKKMAEQKAARVKERAEKKRLAEERKRQKEAEKQNGAPRV